MRFRRRGSRRTSKKVSITILFVLIALIGVGYAYINSTLSIGGTTTITKNSWNVHFDNIDTVNGTLTDDESINITPNKTSITFNINLETIEDSYQIDVDIVNDGGIDAMLNSISLTGLTDNQKEYLEFYATYNNGTNLTINDLLSSGEFDVISVFIKYKDGLTLEDVPNTTDYLTLNLTLGYGQAKKNIAVSRGTSLFKTIVDDAILDTNIDFTKVSSDTNGKGKYIVESTKDDENPIYYYRGEVDNNNVLFANKCWKIVRTTENGGVKLLYNGNPSSGKCTATGTDTTIGTSYYNSTGDNSMGGYMTLGYNTSTYEEAHSNVNNSNLKTTIDNWYATNMTTYTNKLEDAIWCNERQGLSYGRNASVSYANLRINSIKKPSLECVQENDRFTVNEKNGNGKLIYPVATITTDEAYYAGAVGTETTSTTFLNIGYNYWTLTPSAYTTSYEMSFYNISDSGKVGNWGYASYYVRPMISLKRGTRFSLGTGTQKSPYVVN